jgi:hypothetical protein
MTPNFPLLGDQTVPVKKLNKLILLKKSKEPSAKVYNIAALKTTAAAAARKRSKIIIFSFRLNLRRKGFLSSFNLFLLFLPNINFIALHHYSIEV